MNTTHHTKTKWLVAAFGAAAATVPASLFAGAGTAHADDPCYGALQGSYYCSLLPGSIRHLRNRIASAARVRLQQPAGVFRRRSPRPHRGSQRGRLLVAGDDRHP